MNKLNIIIISILVILATVCFNAVAPLVMGLLLGLALSALVLGLNAGRYASFVSWPLLMGQGFGVLSLPTVYMAFFVFYISQSFLKTIRSKEEEEINGYVDNNENSVRVLLGLIKAEWQHKTIIYTFALVLLTILVLVGVPQLLVRYTSIYTPLLLTLSLPVSISIWAIYLVICVDKKDRFSWGTVAVCTAGLLYLLANYLGSSPFMSLTVLGPLVLLSKSKLDKDQLQQFLNIDEEEILGSHYNCSLSARAMLLVVLSNLFAFTSQSALLAIEHKDKGIDSIQARINNGFIGAISDVVCLFILVLMGLVRGDMDLMGRLAFAPTLQEWMTILLVSIGLVLLIGSSFGVIFNLYKNVHSATGLSVILLDKIYKYILLVISVIILVVNINSLLMVLLIGGIFTMLSLLVRKSNTLGSASMPAIPLFILATNF